MLKKLKKNPRIVLLYFLSKFEWKWVSDKTYLRVVYWAELGKRLNLEKPKTFNEKLNWKKIYDRNDQYTIMADKYLVKHYIAEKVGEKYLIPLYGVWNSFEEIDFDILPEAFVLKTTHDSGGVILCNEKKNFNKEQAREFLNKRLNKNYFWWRREWPYKNIKPRIIAEEYVKELGKDYLPVYKFFCFHGKPRIVQCIQNDKTEKETIDYFDENWNLLNLKQNFPNSIDPPHRPEKLNEMIQIAKKLSEGFDFIRVDLYVINNAVKFSEFTFYSDAGINVFEPEEWDAELGKWLRLPIEN